MSNEITDILKTDDSLKNSLKDQKDTLSQALWSQVLDKKKSSNWFLSLAEDVAWFLISSKSSDGTFAKNQISTSLSNVEDSWIDKVYTKIPA